jgi:asparagine synthase (glutamine-hydrolysing)
MCGIAGIAKLHGETVDTTAFMKALTIMRHRGPDDEGSLLLETSTGKFEERGGPDTPEELHLAELSSPSRIRADLALGNRRLSIIDLSPKGHQPMSNEAHTVWVVFNGEVYNYRELRDELVRAGHTFMGDSDTEVVVHGYEEWGINTLLSKTVGMWGFAVWDQEKKRLILARDRFGIKPLYYHSDGTQLVFASEIKAIAMLIKSEINRNRVAEFLWFKPYTANETFYSGVNQVMASHFVELDFNTGELNVQRYWELSNIDTSYRDVDAEEPARNFYELFEKSIRFHMRSDVPVGTCLSGGLDSSSIVCTVQKLLDKSELREKGLASIKKLKTFSSVPQEQRISELAYIQEIIRYSDVEPFFVTPTFEEFFNDFDEIVSVHDEPFEGPSVYMGYRVIKLAKQNGIKVLLDGQGGDESLAGYQKYLLNYLFDLARAHKYVTAVREFFSTTDLTRPYFTKYVRRRSGMSRSAFQKVIKADVPADTPLEYPRRNLAEYLRYDLLAGSIIEILKYEDTNSMAFSIESRVPFLFHPLIEYVFSLPMTAKIRKGWTKYLLREAMRGTLPEEVRLRRSKLGFPAPEEEWADRLIKEKPEWCVETVRAAGDYVDLQGFRQLCARVLAKKREEDTRLFWRVLLLARWLQLNSAGESKKLSDKTLRSAAAS